MWRLGVVSFLNSQPLIDGLCARPDVACRFAVPAALPRLLDDGEVDAALVPIIDVLRGDGRYRVLSDACIGCDGETMTVRVFSQTPPDRVTALHADTDSHTSVNLARVLWRELYGRELEIRPLDASGGLRSAAAAQPAVLLIGDKVVDPARGGFAYEVDLGGAWRAHSGLPFVFAVWAVRRETAEEGNLAELAALLSAARDRGVRRAVEIARDAGPRHGWAPAIAERYLTRCLRFTLDERMLAGANLFGRMCAAAGLAPPAQELAWAAAQVLPAAAAEGK